MSKSMPEKLLLKCRLLTMSRYAAKFASTTAAYKVDVSKHEAAKVSKWLQCRSCVD